MTAGCTVYRIQNTEYMSNMTPWGGRCLYYPHTRSIELNVEIQGKILSERGQMGLCMVDVMYCKNVGRMSQQTSIAKYLAIEKTRYRYGTVHGNATIPCVKPTGISYLHSFFSFFLSPLLFLPLSLLLLVFLLFLSVFHLFFLSCHCRDCYSVHLRAHFLIDRHSS